MRRRLRAAARAAVDHAERTRDDAIAAAVTDVVLHKNGADFRSHDRAGWTRFQATGFLAMFANVGKKNPAEWIFPSPLPNDLQNRDLISLLVGPARGT